MHFGIDIEFTKILGEFKQKEICRFIHDMPFQVISWTFWVIFYYIYIYIYN